MKITKKTKIRLVIGAIILLIGLIGVDMLTTYKVKLGSSSVKPYDEYFMIEMSSGTSVGYFKEAKLKKIDEGIYRIDAYFSLLSGEYSGYMYKLDNPNGYIKELRNYGFDNPEEYEVIYKAE